MINSGRILVGLVLAALPLILLGWRNWRALPLGGLIMAFTALCGLGAFAIGGLGPWGRAALAATILAIAALFFVNAHLVASSVSARNAWVMASFAAWFIAGLIYLTIPGPAVSEVLEQRKRVEYEALTARNAATAKADSDKSRPPELLPNGRAALISQVLDAILAERVGANVVEVSRFRWFGDPVTSPESVTVWVIYPDELKVFREYGPTTYYLYGEVNGRLHAGGYPNRVAVGGVPQEMLADTGGEAAYFGSRGELVLPQFTSERMTREWYDAFPLPERRGAGGH
jgi:hypothetical protein